jgi:hypothetical protein
VKINGGLQRGPPPTKRRSATLSLQRLRISSDRCRICSGEGSMGWRYSGDRWHDMDTSPLTGVVATSRAKTSDSRQFSKCTRRAITRRNVFGRVSSDPVSFRRRRLPHWGKVPRDSFRRIAPGSVAPRLRDDNTQAVTHAAAIPIQLGSPLSNAVASLRIASHDVEASWAPGFCTPHKSFGSVPRELAWQEPCLELERIHPMHPALDDLISTKMGNRGAVATVSLG